MKKILLIALFAGIRIAVFAQACDECSRPRVALYDSFIFSARPENHDSIVAWLNIYWPAAAARGYMRANDPTENCIVWKDGAMINAHEIQGGKLLFGPEFSNKPPAGPLSQADYIIYSKVVTQGSNYVFTLFLETAESREIVKSVEVEFDATTESANNAGIQAALQMMPLFETLRQYGINKRNTDVNVAIRDLWKNNTPESITLEPDMPSVDPGETIDVTVKMVDCDGVALANSRIIFRDSTVQLNPESPELPLKGTKGGRVIPDVAVTDGSGEVTVKFKAGNNSGVAEIVANYPHLKPCGRADAFTGTAPVTINPHVYFEGSITITLTDNSYYPQKKDHREMTTQVVDFHSRITGKIIRSRVERYTDDPETRLECGHGMQCPVLGGSSYFTIPDKKRPGKNLAEIIYPITVESEKSGMGYKTINGVEKYVQTMFVTAAGTNDVEAVSFDIGAYVAPEGQLQPLLPHYVMRIAGGKQITKLFAHAYGKGRGEEWDYNLERLAPVNGPFSIGIPYVIADPAHVAEGSEIYGQLLIENYKELDEFMLNPDGRTFLIKASGKRYFNDNDNREDERLVSVSLNLSVPRGGIDQLK